MTLFGFDWEVLNNSANTTPFEKILKNRGFSAHDLKDETIHSPLMFQDMEKAVARIKQAIAQKERIMVFGDYDADGISGAAILIRTLRQMGAEASCRIPHREEDGYGLKMKFVDEFITLGVELVITVDCGIACPREVETAQVNNIDVIITDHHDIPLEPAKQAYAIIHPKYADGYPFKHLSGSGVAYKLASALTEDAYKYLDLASIGTIADLVPLTGENRSIARRGLKQMAKTFWRGLNALKNTANISEFDLKNLDSDMIGYRLAPRINAAGRIKSPYTALYLLISDGADVEKLAVELNELNVQRQDLVKKIISKIEYDESEKIIFIKGDWQKGVLGLIAGKLSEKTNKPALAMTEKNGVLTGSARSPAYFDITGALKRADSLLKEYGGHKKAAGFGVEKKNFQEFKKVLLEQIATVEIPAKKLMIDCELEERDLNLDMVSKIEKFRPFGEENACPKFLIKNVKILEVKMVGSDSSHLKLTGVLGRKKISGIKFKASQVGPLNGMVSLAGSLKKDSYAPEGWGVGIEDLT